ncbi:PhzF family phenazine biosynthesis isomerase [Streptomyces sp. NPDC051940]|uniref:PhzF family phenazine biosynthesis protein n=1 Tax=Streptomyces sp. NPDC051940 TaxID=3155675 RepID=UPI003439FC9A
MPSRPSPAPVGIIPVTVVNACLRDGSGGSPTAVLDDVALTDAARARVPGLVGASHAVFVARGEDTDAVSLRFFTAAGELPACGHGTVAALVWLAERAGAGADHRFTLRTANRVFDGWTSAEGAHPHAAFDPGPVDLRDPRAEEADLVLPALGLAPDDVAGAVRVAGVGRARILVPVASRSVLASVAPDFARLRTACDRTGLLGAYVYSVPDGSGRAAARMFAPSIGVPEDIANANSTACLAAHMAGGGSTVLSVDMGDSLGSPATITATVRPGPRGPAVRIGGTAAVVRTTGLPEPVLNAPQAPPSNP